MKLVHQQPDSDLLQRFQNDRVLELGASDQHEHIEKLFVDAQDDLVDPQTQEVFLEWTAQWRRELGNALPRGLLPRLRNRTSTDAKGHKLSIQVSPGLYWIAKQHDWNGLGPNVVRLFTELEVRQAEASTTFRTLLPLAHIPTFVTARVIGYRPGRQLGQRWHFDPSIATIIHREAHDSRLIAENAPSLPSGPQPTATMIMGAAASTVFPGVEPLRHAVLPIDQGTLRVSITYFLWRAPAAWAGVVGLHPSSEETDAA
ncbi:MAG: 2OG-Fe(II) oxygenase family protein [Mycolicibacterium frederiksbergense]|nr:2OG-Fe(II) oxygenase family protein [Mycolicibacterium frederiksbergense]